MLPEYAGITPALYDEPRRETPCSALRFHLVVHVLSFLPPENVTRCWTLRTVGHRLHR